MAQRIRLACGQDLEGPAGGSSMDNACAVGDHAQSRPLYRAADRWGGRKGSNPAVDRSSEVRRAVAVFDGLSALAVRRRFGVAGRAAGSIIPQDTWRKRARHLSPNGQGRSCSGGCRMSTIEMDRNQLAKHKLRVIDCDIHPAMTSWTEVHPYLEKRWIDHLSVYGSHLRHAFSEALSHPRMSPDAARIDAYPDEGGPPGSSLELMRKQHLDPNGVQVGMLIPLRWNPGSQRNLDFGAALTRAMNTWQVERWVKQEPRLRASVLVAQEDTVASVAEIDARGGDPNFTQILILPRTDEPLGRRRYWPIFEAAVRNNLPVTVHVGGTNGHPSTGGGWPSYYMEEHHSVAQTMQAVLTSLVFEGVFERFPKLRVVIMEGGLGWIPSLSARMDKHWSRLRSQVPHLKRPPSEYVREQVWFSTQPMEEPATAAELIDLFDRIGWDRLLFSTDYPHWDFDDPRYAFKANLSEAQRDQLLYGNSCKFYGLG